MAECSSNTKWVCSACTYLNYETSLKCTLCLNPRDKPLIIEEAATTISGITLVEDDELGRESAVAERWACPVCTYLNWLRTKRCVQCFTDRPLRYERNFDTSVKHQLDPVVSRALNKWSCPTCTFDNWPNAMRCTMCGLSKPTSSAQEATCSTNNVNKSDIDGLTRSLALSGLDDIAKNEQYTSALGIYLRRFAANDHIESLFFKAASSIGRGDLEMVNSVLEYLINEGNIQRSFSSFESRLLNAHGIFRICFEPGDSLVKIAKKCDCSDLVKLMKRVSSTDERLPCVINCATRTRIYTKVAQLLAIRNGGFNSQFIAHPYNFSIIKFPMLATDINMEIMKIMMKSAPAIPPTFVFVDCYDTQNGTSNVVGRPPNFLMKNRGGAYSLCDAIFQTMFGICDRFNILRAALKYTMIRSAHFFKPRWKDQCVRMARDCGLMLNMEDIDNDWEEAVNAITNEDECLDPDTILKNCWRHCTLNCLKLPEKVVDNRKFQIHIWVLSHVVRRPIVVVSTNDPIDIEDLEILDLKPQKKRQCLNHIFEGIYLPIFWGSVPVLPVTQSPLVIAFRNGLFNAVIVSDGYYQRDKEIQRFLKINHSRRYSENLFRFLTVSELNNSNFIAQFIRLGACNANSITIRRDPHPFLYESLLFYSNWVNAIHCCDIENTGELRISQLEQNIESPFDLSHLCYSDKFSIFSSKAISVLKRNDQSIAESSSSEPAVLDSEEEEDDDEDNESLVDETA